MYLDFRVLLFLFVWLSNIFIILYPGVKLGNGILIVDPYRIRTSARMFSYLLVWFLAIPVLFEKTYYFNALGNSIFYFLGGFFLVSLFVNANTIQIREKGIWYKFNGFIYWDQIRKYDYENDKIVIEKLCNKRIMFKVPSRQKTFLCKLLKKHLPDQ